MNWQLKCLAFHLLDKAPFGHVAHAALQRYLTGRYFQRVTELLTPEFHLANFRALPPGAIALEFGCGRNLLTSLLLSHAGAGRVHAYDLARLATAEQINHVIEQLRGLLPGDWPAIRSLDDLDRLYRIAYRAPADVRATGLPDRSVDFACSTATMEHIPEAEIRAILIECARICTPHARLSFIIDYHDHYGRADRNISLWNFYRYSNLQWRKFNPGNHYQNRLRHSDHEKIMTNLGFRICAAERVIPDWSEAHLARVPICQDFAHYSRSDLLTAKGKFALALP